MFYKMLRFSLIPCICAAVVLSLAAIVHSAPLNFAAQIANNTGSTQNGISLTFEGDQTANLSALSDPWTGNPYTVSYDPVTDRTTITIPFTFNIGQIIDPGIEFKVPPSLFPLDPGMTVPFNGSFFGARTAAPSGPPKFLLLYAEATQQSTTNSADNWYELPYQMGNPVTLDAPAGIGTLDLSNAEYFITDTQIPLDSLNMTDLPPTDPRFQPIPGISDGTALVPGTTITVLPEPAALTLLAVGGLGLFLLRRRKSV